MYVLYMPHFEGNLVLCDACNTLILLIISQNLIYTDKFSASEHAYDANNAKKSDGISSLWMVLKSEIVSVKHYLQKRKARKYTTQDT